MLINASYCSKNIDMDLSYILNHLGEERANYLNAVSPPIFQTSNFTFNSVSDLRTSIKDEMNIPFYTRGCNPTVSILRKKIAALEGAEDALVMSSGSAAASAAIISQLAAGDHLISVSKPYSWTFKLITLFLDRFGVEATFVDGTKVENFENAIKPNTKLIVLESPNSLTFELQDLAAISSLAKFRNITTVIDNSYCSPLNQKPIELGIDLVFHSATKYLAGHSDAVCGVICGSTEKIKQIFASEFMTLGAIISPNDAFLLMRGLRTLPLRMERVSKSVFKILHYLEKNENVAKIYHPFSESFPQLALANKQMKSASGLLSFELKAENREEVDLFCDSLNTFLLACSWGGHESLVFPICGLDDSANYKDNELPWNLIRINIGLEDPQYLIDDLDQAFKKYRNSEYFSTANHLSDSH